ncbi:DUF6275 family protein [Intestinibacter bartlettii]|jgi:lin0103 protein|uniref:DUF6275 family protein n=1 Tax=Intestinibacter bartlettii TaxID=261299 RepID=UPI00204E38F3|nr:MAG TPA: hypothetical protein [Caudoviricetes sp.]
MNEQEFLDWCKDEVVKYTNNHLDKSDNKQITKDDVFMVWCAKVLQNNKALLSTTLFDGMYYECTYNGDKKEMYIDAYKKWENYKVEQNKYGKEDYDFLLGIYAFVGVYALAYTIFSIVLAILHIHLSNAIDWIASIVLSILSIVYVVRLNIKRAELIERKKE